MTLPGLTDRQKQLIASIPDVMRHYSGQRQIYNSLVRRQGKSVAQTYTTNADPEKIKGKEITHIWVDDYEDDMRLWGREEPILKAKDPVVVFDDPKWPGSRVEVWKKEIDKRDPRNPNPKAPRQELYEIRGEFCIREEIRGEMFARQRAKHLHEQAVKRIQKELQEANPLFGRF